MPVLAALVLIDSVVNVFTPLNVAVPHTLVNCTSLNVSHHVAKVGPFPLNIITDVLALNVKPVIV